MSVATFAREGLRVVLPGAAVPSSCRQTMRGSFTPGGSLQSALLPRRNMAGLGNMAQGTSHGAMKIYTKMINKMIYGAITKIIYGAVLLIK